MQYGTARTNHQPTVSPESMYPGKNKMTVHNYDGTVWKDFRKGKEWPLPQANDESENLLRRSIPLLKAMEQSINSPFVQLGMDVGLNKVGTLRRPRNPREQLRQQPEPVVLHGHLLTVCDPDGRCLRDVRQFGHEL